MLIRTTVNPHKTLAQLKMDHSYMMVAVSASECSTLLDTLIKASEQDDELQQKLAAILPSLGSVHGNLKERFKQLQESIERKDEQTDWDAGLAAY